MSGSFSLSQLSLTIKAGEVKSYKNFAFLAVNDASHQVPMSVPKQVSNISMLSLNYY